MTTGNERTTGIGSLPHHNVDSAIEFAFRFGIPYLPQIPIRNPWEFMIAQALESLPGLQVEKDGQTRLDPDVWASRAHALDLKLERAFAESTDPRAFEEFEPSSGSSSCWQPFLFELAERGLTRAKVQIAGPMTVQWALTLRDGSPAERLPGLSAQLYRMVLARALAMARKLKAQGVKPLLFIDEPGLYGLTLASPKQLLGLQELRLMIEALRKEAVEVGLHCCSNTEWDAILELNLNYLSIDSSLSLGTLLSPRHVAKLDAFLASGGKLSLGVINTRESAARAEPAELFFNLLRTFETEGALEPGRVQKCLSEALYTPACGLAFHPAAQAESILARLNEFARFCETQLPPEVSSS